MDSIAVRPAAIRTEVLRARSFVLVVFCLALAARALEVYGTPQEFDLPVTGPTTAPWNWSETISVSPYNGTADLQAIQFDITGTLATNLVITNTNTQSIDVVITLYGYGGGLNDPTLMYLGREEDGDIIVTALPYYQATHTLAPLSTSTISIEASLTSDSDTHTSPDPMTDLDLFSGAGNITLYAWSPGTDYDVSLAEGSEGKTPPTIVSVSVTPAATVTITYYVPEPGMGCLAGLAALGLALRRPRRREPGPSMRAVGS
ncbi:MAG: choice-of-anchor E domain-containing protein [Lentisphaeria bacterium]|nr:choice-of-anchor E domain-containing protein [Lentisphaeria bacterium]